MVVIRTGALRRHQGPDGAKFINQYRIGKALGSGTSSKVVAATDAAGHMRVSCGRRPTTALSSR